MNIQLNFSILNSFEMMHICMIMPPTQYIGRYIYFILILIFRDCLFKLHILWLYKMFTWFQSEMYWTRYQKVLASAPVSSSFSTPLVYQTLFWIAFFHLLIRPRYHSIEIHKCSLCFFLHPYGIPLYIYIYHS